MVPLLQSQPNIEQLSNASPSVGLVFDVIATSTDPNPSARTAFQPNSAKLVAASTKMTKDFKTTCSSYLASWSLQPEGLWQLVLMILHTLNWIGGRLTHDLCGTCSCFAHTRPKEGAL